MLDEPTNDLDTDTLAAVEDTLDGWPGTLLVVSHDRYLLERVCDRQVALLGDGRVRDLPGGVEEYLTLRRQSLAAAAAPSSPAGARSGSSAATATTAASAGDARAARKELARIERQIARLTGQEEKLHAEMAEKATDHEAVLALDGRLRALQAERDGLEEEWLVLAEAAG
jgi:ATPase subunit of ABC transporter with duplicated ATPase domains